MNPFLRMIMLFGLMEGADSGVTGAAMVDSAPVASDPATSSDPAPSSDPVAPVDTPAIDPNDPMAALQAAMDAQLGADDAAETPATPEAGAVPQEFEKLLGISEFVKAPEHVEAAVRAADEVWKVANGQEPVSGILEAMRAGNPQGFQKVFQDLAQYVEQVSGKKLGEAPATPPDPNQARLDAIEKRFAEQEKERQQAAFDQQAQAANLKAQEFMSTKLKGTFGEGQDAHFIGLIAQKLGPEGVQRSMQEVLAGNTKSLESAFKAVKNEETVRLKAYMANITKQHRTLSSAVPAVKGGAAKPTSSLAPLEGETPAQQAKRIWDQL